MLTRDEIGKTLAIISRAWGRTQSGYCFFPYLDRIEQEKVGRRRAGWHEKGQFMWPRDKEKIIDYLHTHQQYDVYWCPNLFEEKSRKTEYAMDECALWADLDEVDPRILEEAYGYQPTVAWETSPNSYQCLWILSQGDIQGASWDGNENKKMTYMIGADNSGWDSTQLLRIPGWENHKVEYRIVGENGVEHPKGNLLWDNGRTYLADDFDDLPELEEDSIEVNITDAVTAEIDGVDRHGIIARVNLKLNKRARDLLHAKKASGDLSDQLWYLIRCLADAGCSVSEIVAVVRPTPWNKFADRNDEIRRLITEASKAIAKKTTKEDKDEEDREYREGLRLDPTAFAELIRNVKPPKFLVNNLITQGSCGFIAGEPKSFKSWVGLDLAFAVATGGKFLNHEDFQVVEPGPVFYIQEEDPLPTLAKRAKTIWENKTQDYLTWENGQLVWNPPTKNRPFNPDINAYVQQSFTISDEAWMLWLDDQLEKGMRGAAYKLLILDTLMMTAGEVDENKSQEMTNKIFRPLKVISRKWNISVQVIHHMSKAEKSRPGQRLLGSTANHAWAEDSLYLSNATGGNRVRMDLESKTLPSQVYGIENIVGKRDWDPQVAPWTKDEAADTPAIKPQQEWQVKNGILMSCLQQSRKGLSNKQLSEVSGIPYQTVRLRMMKMEEHEAGVKSKMVSGKQIWVLDN